MSRLLWPELGPADVEDGWLPEVPAMRSSDVLSALAHRHPMDGFNGMPGRWVFVREVQATTGSYSGVQRFDAVAVGLTPAVKYARVVYEVKVSRADWLRELRPMVRLQDRFGDQLRLSLSTAVVAFAGRVCAGRPASIAHTGRCLPHHDW